MKRSWLIIALTLALALGLMIPALAVSAAGENPPKVQTYIVVLDDPAVPSYQGGIPGLAAANPQTAGASKWSINSPASRAYRNYLVTQQTKLLNSLNRQFGRKVEVVFNYQYSINGMAIKLTAEEAASLKSMPGVADVVEDWVEYAQTDAGPQWIGAAGVWDGSATGVSAKGEGVVVGIIDTGINADHPSFAVRGGDGYTVTNPRGHYYGWCAPDSPHYTETLGMCNDKLIGVWSGDTDTPEDYNGHGSHVGSTSAGNVLTNVTYVARTYSYTFASISGVAPHANIIAYNIEGVQGTGSAPGSSILAAINQAIVDEVDVVNYSFGGTSAVNPWTSQAEIAWLNARAAGVFVSTSAGNSGPGESTTANKSAPWYISVGNATHNRAVQNAVINMTGGTNPPADLIGKGATSAYGPAQIIYAGWYNQGATKTLTYDEARQCLFAFQTGLFTGKIVACDRGVNARVDKGANVLAGGAGGMVLLNTAATQNVVGDNHYLPAVHLSYASSSLVSAWLTNTAIQTATIRGASVVISDALGDMMSGDSSRGPASNPNILKPDIIAPGTDILAAVQSAHPPSGQPEFDMYSGTSMASPHVAGAAALLVQLHPDWTPAEVQSALMSTAMRSATHPVKEDGVTPATPFDRGSGRAYVSYAAKAGLVLNEIKANYEAANPALGGDPSKLNLPSLAQESCIVNCSWTRVVRSTKNTTVTWTTSVSNSAGMSLTIAPASFVLGPGQTQVVTVTADLGSLAVGSWAFGEVQLTPNTTTTVAAHFPVAAKAAFSNLPSLSYGVVRLDKGTYRIPNLQVAMNITTPTVRLRGLVSGTVVERYLVQDPTPDNTFDTVTGTFYVSRTVSGASDVRVVAEILDSTSNDLDMWVYRDANSNGTLESTDTLVGSAATGAVLEYISLSGSSVTTGTYFVLVLNYDAAVTDTVGDWVVLSTAVVPNADLGNATFSITPAAPLAPGTKFTLNVNYTFPKWTMPFTPQVAGVPEVAVPWYGVFDLGTDPANPGNIKTIALDIAQYQSLYFYLPIVVRNSAQ